VILCNQSLHIRLHTQFDQMFASVLDYADAQVIPDWAEVASFVSLEEFLLQDLHRFLVFGDEYEIVNVHNDDLLRNRMDEDAWVCFDRLEAKLLKRSWLLCSRVAISVV
jgi:hypothetical protein